MKNPRKNDPPATETMERTTFDLEIALKRRLETLADTTERSLSGMLRLILREYLDTKGNGK